MRPETKKRLIILLILLMFGGSTFAFAIQFALPPEEKPKQQPDTIDRPLSDIEEAPYLQRNFLVVRYYYSSDCPNCTRAEDAIKGLREELGSIFLERISVEQWPNATEAAGITATPAIYLKGSSTTLFSSAPTYDELFSAACSLYFDPPLVCG